MLKRAKLLEAKTTGFLMSHAEMDDRKLKFSFLQKTVQSLYTGIIFKPVYRSSVSW